MNPKELKQTRLSLKMTQVAFGAALGMTGNTIARYERGESQPENPTLFALAVEQVRQQKISAAFEPEWQALLARSKQMADELKAEVDPQQQRIRTPAEIGLEPLNLKKLSATARRSVQRLQKSKEELDALIEQQLEAEDKAKPAAKNKRQRARLL